MKHRILILTLIMLACLSYGQTLPKKISETNFSIGKSIKIESTVLNETRELNIYLPLSYASESSKTYPVIYLLDGSKDEDFIHISGIVQFGSFSWVDMMPESIVVGIGNVDRKRDFTFPSQSKVDQKEFPTSGHSENFIKFLQEELQPFIETNFRAKDSKTIIGQSLGGLLATEILLRKPELFDNYIIVSPSLWWSDERLLNEKPLIYDSDKSIYIAVGEEGEVMKKTARALFNKLNANKRENTRVFFGFMENKTHGDALHIAVYNALEVIFKAEKE